MPNLFHRGYLLLFTVFTFTFPGSVVFAEQTDRQNEIDLLLKTVKEQGELLKAQQKSIDELQGIRKQPPAAKQSKTAKPVEPVKKNAEKSKSEPQKPASNATVAQKGEKKPVGKPPEESEPKELPEVATIFAQPGVLTPKGVWLIEPSVQFSHASNERVVLFGYTIIPAISIGVIDVRSVKSDTLSASISARYGVSNRFEVDVRVPYVYRQDTSTEREQNTGTSTDKVFNLNDHALGDIDFGMRYQLNQPTGGPFYIAGLRIKTDTGRGPFDLAFDPVTELRTELPTGSGFWGIQPKLTAIFSSDPAVFYGSINYMFHLEKDINSSVGKYDPGDIYGFNFGMGLGLNEKASISLGYDHSIIGRSRQNGDVPEGVSTTQVGSFVVGASYRVTNTSTFNLSIGIGVTEYSPDVQVSIGFPMRF